MQAGENETGVHVNKLSSMRTGKPTVISGAANPNPADAGTLGEHGALCHSSEHPPEPEHEEAEGGWGTWRLCWPSCCPQQMRINKRSMFWCCYKSMLVPLPV